MLQRGEIFSEGAPSSFSRYITKTNIFTKSGEISHENGCSISYDFNPL